MSAPEGPQPDLSIIIVSWNVKALLRACLASLGSGHATGEPSHEVIVVDNCSADGSAEMVAAEFPTTHVIANAANLGFTRANNQGIAAARGRHVFFLNPDTVVQPGALRTLVDYLDAHPQVGAAGPRLRYGDGSLQSSRRRFPTLMTALCESSPLAWHWRSNPWARAYHMDDVPESEIQPVDWLVGAALLVRDEALKEVGGFDEGFFMYSEELDWCRRARAAGWEIVYHPGAAVTHYEGKSSEQAVAARHIRFQSSKVRYLRKHHGPARAAALRVALLAMFGLEWALEGLKWALGSKRVMRRERLRAYAGVVRSGLRSSDPMETTQGRATAGSA